MSSIDEFNLTTSRICGILQSDDKRQKKKILEEIKKDLLCETSDVNKNLFQVFKAVIRCFSDKAEICRELAVAVVTETLNTSDKVNEEYISYVIPVLQQRIGGQEIIEPSEEVRLSMTKLLHTIVIKFYAKLKLFIEDIILILSRTITDPFPMVKKESCDCACKLCKSVPEDVYEHSEILIKPLLQNFSFQHHRIRSAAITTVGTIIRYGKSKSIEMVAVPLAERLFDSTPTVRQATTRVVADWLRSQPDRYSYFHRLVPLLLTSLSDELEEIREETWQLWEEIGTQYANENENDLKDKMDFLKQELTDYPLGLRRPNLGCRELVRRQLLKVIAALCGDLEDWRTDVRVRAAQLAVVLLQHAEQHATHHITRLLPALVRAARDDETTVVENVKRGGELLGYFVPGDVWTKLLLPALEDSPCYGGLRVLAAVIRGAQQKELLPQAQTVAKFICNKDICWSRKGIYQLELLSCVSALMSGHAASDLELHEQLFIVIITTMGLASEQQVADTAAETLQQLSKCEQCSVETLFERHCLTLLEDIRQTAGSWSVCSSERFIFEAVLSNSGRVFGLFADIILDILKAALKPENDPEIRLKVFTILSNVLKDKEETLKKASDAGLFLISFIQEVALPNLAWHAGRAAEAVRTACVACVWAALDPNSAGLLSDPRILVPLASALFPALLALVEDQSRRSRLLALRSLCRLVMLCRAANIFSAENLLQVYPVVLRRLDDVNDEVRSSAVETLVLLYSELPPKYSVETCRGHIEALYSTMLIHLDDPQEDFRQTALGALKQLSHVSPKVLYEKLESTKHNFRNVSACQELFNYIGQLKKS